MNVACCISIPGPDSKQVQVFKGISRDLLLKKKKYFSCTTRAIVKHGHNNLTVVIVVVLPWQKYVATISVLSRILERAKRECPV